MRFGGFFMQPITFLVWGLLPESVASHNVFSTSSLGERGIQFVYPCRRSNRPGKLSGKRTFEDHKTLESGVDTPAEGITISGARTEGASGKGLLCRGAGIFRF